MFMEWSDGTATKKKKELIITMEDAEEQSALAGLS